MTEARIQGIPVPKDRPVKLSAYEWQKVRHDLWVRCMATCERCGKSLLGGDEFDLSNMHAHHKVKRSKHRNDSLENLEALCWKCHEASHGRIW